MEEISLANEYSLNFLQKDRIEDHDLEKRKMKSFHSEKNVFDDLVFLQI